MFFFKGLKTHFEAVRAHKVRIRRRTHLPPNASNMTHLPQATGPAAAAFDARTQGSSVETLMADPAAQESVHSKTKTLQARQDKEASLCEAAADNAASFDSTTTSASVCAPSGLSNAFLISEDKRPKRATPIPEGLSVHACDLRQTLFSASQATAIKALMPPFFSLAQASPPVRGASAALPKSLASHGEHQCEPHECFVDAALRPEREAVPEHEPLVYLSLLSAQWPVACHREVKQLDVSQSIESQNDRASISLCPEAQAGLWAMVRERRAKRNRTEYAPPARGPLCLEGDGLYFKRVCMQPVGPVEEARR